MANSGITLVYGGGKTGLMGALSDAVLEGGGRVVGVLPKLFDTEELANRDLTELHLVEDMHQRKMMMFEMAGGFIALPGGFGTFEELFEILTWAQVGLHQRPIGLFNFDGYFEPLLGLIRHAEDEGFIYAEHDDLLVVDSSPARLLETMFAYTPPVGMERWRERGSDTG
jgi:uncharacterized protein (TIGR00730 family)